MTKKMGRKGRVLITGKCADIDHYCSYRRGYNHCSKIDRCSGKIAISDNSQGG